MKLEYWVIGTVALAVLEWVIGAVKKNLSEESPEPSKATPPAPAQVVNDIELEEMLFAADGEFENTPPVLPEESRDIYFQSSGVTESLSESPVSVKTAPAAGERDPADQDERDVNDIADFLRNHSDQAVIVKEILSPPLALR